MFRLLPEVLSLNEGVPCLPIFPSPQLSRQTCRIIRQSKPVIPACWKRTVEGCAEERSASFAIDAALDPNAIMPVFGEAEADPMDFRPVFKDQGKLRPRMVGGIGCADKVISNNESTKRIVHERHEKHERILLLFVLFVSFVDSFFFLRIRFLMGCSFLGIT